MAKSVKLILITLISLIGLFLAFRGEDLNLIALELKKVNKSGLYLASMILLMSCYIRAIRWKILIEPFGSISISKSLSATMIGYFGNGVLVFRLGELLKAYSISRNSQIKTTNLIGTVILERSLDLLMVFLIFLLSLPWFPVTTLNIHINNHSIIILILLLIAILIALFYHRVTLGNKILHFTNKHKEKKLIQLCLNILDGLISIKKSPDLKKIIFYSIALWIIYLGTTFTIIYSCNINLKFFDICLLFVMGSIALGIPALPGSIGTYDVAVKYFLVVAFNLSNHEALNYVIVSHAISYFPLTVVGSIFFIFSNVNLKQIKYGDNL